MYRELGLMENTKVDRATVSTQLAEMNHRLKDIHTQVSMKENHIVTIENFIEKYLPVRVLSQVSEVFNSVLTHQDGRDSADLRRLANYEKLKYSQYNQVILNDNGIPDIMRVIAETRNKMNSLLQLQRQKSGEVSRILTA